MMLDLTPLATKDYFEMPEHIRRKEYFPNWHRYLILQADKAIAKADLKIKELDGTLARMKAKRLAGTHTLG